MRTPAGSPLQRIVARWSRLPDNVRGALWTLAASAAFSAMAVCMRVVGQTMGVWEMLVLRAAFALALMSPAVARAGIGVFATRRPGAHFARSCLGMGGVVGFFYALQHLDLTLTATLGFTRTLFVIVLAVLFLGEMVRWRRTLATLVGFCGVVVCVQPGTASFEPWALAALGGALLTAGVSTVIKRLTSTDAPLTIVLWTYVVMGGLAIVPAALHWRTPTLDELALIALMALLSTIGQWCMVSGLRAGEATAVVPFEYSRLLFAAAFGFVLFAEIPATTTWLGGAIIIGSTLYIALREARLARSA